MQITITIIPAPKKRLLFAKTYILTKISDPAKLTHSVLAPKDPKKATARLPVLIQKENPHNRPIFATIL